MREVVQLFHFDHEFVSVIAAKTLCDGALIRMVLPVVKTTDEVGWLGVAVGVVRAFAVMVRILVVCNFAPEIFKCVTLKW